MEQKIFNPGNLPGSRRRIVLLALTVAAGLTGLSSFISNTNTSGNKQKNKMTNSINNNEHTMKTIGILGGLGPQATMDLEMRIHKVAQQLIPPAQNSGYPSMVVQYYRHPPVLLNEEYVPVFPGQPDPRMLETAKSLGTMADFLLIPSNGAHLFQKEIEEASGLKVLSLIDVTLEEVKKKGWKKVGVAGL
jgi:hypothetical protein